VVVFDRRGHGKSSSARQYFVEDLRDDIAAIVEQVGLTRPVLVGHSVGSWDVLSYAADSKDVAAVICLDQAIATRDPVWPATYRSDGRSWETKLADAAASLREYTDSELSRVLAESAASYGPAWRSYGPVVRRNIKRQPGGRFTLRPSPIDRVLIEYAWSLVADEPYDAIACPVVIALAERNPGPIHDMFRRLVDRRALDSVVIDTDHDMHLERPAAVAALVRRFS